MYNIYIYTLICMLHYILYMFAHVFVTMFPPVFSCCKLFTCRWHPPKQFQQQIQRQRLRMTQQLHQQHTCSWETRELWELHPISPISLGS